MKETLQKLLEQLEQARKENNVELFLEINDRIISICKEASYA